MRYDGDWQNYRGNWFVADGVLKQSNAGGLSFRLRKNIITNGKISADVHLSTKGQYVGIVGRAKDDKNYYLVRLNSKNNKLELCKVQKGIMTLLGSYNMDVQTAKMYNLFLNMDGEQLKCGMDGNVLIEVTDKTFASGKTGLYGYTWYRNTLNEFEIDNYKIN